MLKGPHKNICVGGIEALDLAHESVIQMHILNLELISVLSALKGTKFSGWLEDKCGLNCAEEGCRVKNVALKYLGNLNADLNTYMAKLGYYNFMKREDELPFVEVDLKKNTYLAIVNDKTFSDGDRFLSLASYFNYKIDGIFAKVEKSSHSWKDEQFDEFKLRLSKISKLSAQRFPALFREYAKIRQKEEIEKI